MKQQKIPRTCFYCKNLTNRTLKPQICGVDGAKVYADSYTFCDRWDCIYGKVSVATPTDKEDHYKDYIDFKLGIQEGRRRDDKISVEEKIRCIKAICAKKRKQMEEEQGVPPPPEEPDRYKMPERIEPEDREPENLFSGRY